MKKYRELKELYTKSFKKAKRQSDLIAASRMGCMLIGAVCMFRYYTYKEPILLWITGSVVLIFFILVGRHGKTLFNKSFYEQLIRINREEIDLSENHRLPPEDGAEFVTEGHPYTHDLDIFGKNSLFQYINRTGLYIGKKALAEYLSSRSDIGELLSRQEAIGELKEKIDWRQHLLALARMRGDHKDFYENLISWSSRKELNDSVFLRIVLYLMPAAFICFIGLYIYSDLTIHLNLATLIFFINLLLLSLFFGKIKSMIFKLDHVDQILSQYSLLIEKVETASFESEKLKNLQNRLVKNNKSASGIINKLSKLYHSLGSIQNPIGSIFFNGIFLYHLYVYEALTRWKRKFSHLIPDWMETLGEIEALNSLANFAYNYPECHFPSLNDRSEICFEEMGHPLIPKEKRVCNDVSFKKQRFIVLTGSNMSGKSTFLRSLGINMVLARAGAPVCARKAEIHPLEIFVSTKSSDSLAKNESYFLAEIKRLTQLVELLEKEPHFVLLDEILRGTNSDDKRSGTIGMIKTLAGKNAFGVIATHDLEVCRITPDYPEVLVNRCFEVEIKENELAFDYRIREGVCKNKSATS